MKTIIRNILVSIFWRILFDNINKINFTEILNNLGAHLRTLSIREQIRILKLFLTDNVLGNSNLNMITQPFEVDFTVVLSTWPRKLFFFGFIFTTVVNVWFIYLKRILLLPFKLGIFSFLYSILGFDVSWVLNLFNVFPFNIPYWVYFQYLTLYNNWLNWWNSTVNIKSITNIPLKEVNKIKNNIKMEKDLVELDSSNNNKIKYIVAGIVIVGGICFALWYFNVFSSNDTGPDPGAGANTLNNPDLLQNVQALSTSQTNLSSQIQIIDNQTQVNTSSSSNSDELWADGNLFSSLNNTSSPSPPDPSPNPWGNNGPPSPTGSTDSTDTITPSSLNSGRPVVLLRRR